MKYYLYAFLLIWTIYIKIIGLDLNYIYGISDYTIKDLIFYMPYILSLSFLINGKYTESLRSNGYLYIIKYKKRSKWVSFIFKDIFLIVLEYVLIISLMYLYINYVNTTKIKFIIEMILFFGGLYFLSILQIFLEYIFGNITSLLIIIAYTSFSTVYLEFLAHSNKSLKIINYFFISFYMDESVRGVHETLYASIVILILIASIYIIFRKYFEKGDII